jgi:hypothetical protein
MKIPNVLGLGFRVFAQAGEQQEANHITNMTYSTPYQIPFKGMVVETDKTSVSYDATSTPTMCVAVPAADGEFVDGWTYISSYTPHPLPGGSDVLYPLTANLNGSTPPYAASSTNWVDITVVPMIPGQLVGFPVYAGQTFTQGLEIAAATGGYVRPAASGDWVFAKVEWSANNATGLSGAKVVSGRVCAQYKKA